MLDGCAEQRFVVGRRGKAELKLRLHERNCVHVRSQSQIRQVERDDLDRVGNRLDGQLGEVDALEIDYACVLANRAEQLPVPRVDRVHALCSRVQQHAGEAACRGPDVERD